MRKQWHVYFGQLLEGLLGELGFRVEREVGLGEMPLKADMVVLQESEAGEAGPLPRPFCYFGRVNLVEFKSRAATFGAVELDQLLAYGLLYRLKTSSVARQDICLWAMASNFSEGYGEHLAGLGVRQEELAPGISRATLAGFQLFHLEFSRLPLEEEYYPFHLFGREKNVRGVIEALLERPDLRRRYLKEVVVLHAGLLEEVLKMKGTLPEELEIDLAAIIRLLSKEKIIREIGEEEIIREIGEEKIIREIGEEKIIREIGEEKIIRLLVEKLGWDRMKRLAEESNA